MLKPHCGIDCLLHDHLDGSYPMLAVLPELWKLTHGNNKPYPFDPEHDHHGQIKEWFGNPLKGDIVQKFSITTGIMQNSETLFLAAKNFVEIRAKQGFRYCEATIAPQYHTFGGLKTGEVIAALINGIKKGESEYPGIEVNLLLGIGREISPEKAVKLVKEFAKCEREYIAGINLVCDESENPPEKHISMFRKAEELLFKKACHADEWVHQKNEAPDFERDLRRLLKNARTAIMDLRIDRGEHFRSLAYDPDLVKIVADRGIGISGCPGSYICSGLVSKKDLYRMKIGELLDWGVLYSINPDDDLFMMNIDEVFAICDEAFHFTEEQKLKLRSNAWKTRFGNRKPVPNDVAL